MPFLNRRTALGALASTLATFGPGRLAHAATTYDIPVGALFPMSGADAEIGENANNALRAALELVDGDYDLDLPLARADHLPSMPGARLKYLLVDHKCDPATARAEAEKLITAGKVVALIGSGNEQVSEVLSEVCDKAGIAFVDTDSTSMALRARASRSSFRIAADEASRARLLFDFFDKMRADRKADIRSVALFHDKEPEDMRAAQLLRTFAADRKVAIVQEAPHARGTPGVAIANFQGLRSRVDALLFIGGSRDSSQLAASMLGHGNVTPVVCYPATMLDRVAGSAEDAGQGVFFMHGIARDCRMNEANIAAINTLYRSFAHKDLDELSALQFTGLLLLAFAINESRNAAPALIVQKLGLAQFPGYRTIMPWDQMAFDNMGRNNGAGVIIAQRQGEKVATVFPPRVATGVAQWNI